MSQFDYIRDPDAIYEESFRIINEEVDLDRFDHGDRSLARRVVHACGMPEIAEALVFHGSPGDAGRAALLAEAAILTDVEMVAHGIIRKSLPAGNKIICTLGNAEVPARSRALGTTRSAAALDDWMPHLDGAVVAIGNAPTALFRLLEMLAAGAPRPAVILAFPVGFVGAAESKQALIDHAAGLPFATLPGRRGGSAMASAAVNALAMGAGE